MTIKTNPYKAVSFVESSVRKALANAGYLIADIKYDGVRGNIVVDSESNSWLSRVSKAIPALTHLETLFRERWDNLLADDRCIFPQGFMLDGELMVKGVDFNTGSGLLRTKYIKKDNVEFSLPSEGKKAPFMLNPELLTVRLYAVMPLEAVESGHAYDVMNCLMPEHVKAMLALLKLYIPEINWELATSYEVYDMVELQELYTKVRAEGHEGIIVKDPMGIYQRGKKSGWWKMKPEEEADGVITGLVWGTEGLANEGKVIGFEVLLESGRVVNACNISRTLMNEFTENVLTYGEHFYNDWACQISYMEETPDGSLRHPTFVCFRGTEENPSEKI